MKKILFSLVAVIQGLHAFNGNYTGSDAQESYEQSDRPWRFVKEDYIKYFPFYEKYADQCMCLDASIINLKYLPEPYCNMEKIVPFNDWGIYSNFRFFEKLFQYNRIKMGIEIGSYYGLSTRHIASLMPDNSELYAIDPWDYFPGMYEQFLSNVILTGLCNKIIPVRCKSDQVTLNVPVKFDLVYVDGDHETLSVLKDLELYYPLLHSRGIMCGDDWLLYSVRMAVESFAKTHNLTIYAACNFWFLKDEGAYQQKDLLEVDDRAWIF